MGLARIVRFITRHPLNRNHKLRAVVRFVRWQVAARVWPDPIVVPFAGNARLVVRKGLTGATGNVYCGLHEFEDMALVIHALRDTDTFIDVGANVGTYSVLAGAVAGARVISFEPAPATFAYLQDNLRINNLAGRAQAHNSAVGRERGTVSFTASLDTLNHVTTAAERQAGAAAATGGTVEAPVVPLDDFADDVAPALIKIDVEGFETEVIAGAGRMLRSDALLGVLMELNGSGSRYGYDEGKLHQTMLDLNFKLCTYAPFERELRVIEGSHEPGVNTLYVRDVDRLRERLKTAPPVAVHGTRL